MRLSIDALLNKAETQKMGHKSSTGPKDKSASNPFGNSDSEDEVYVTALKNIFRSLTRYVAWIGLRLLSENRHDGGVQ